MGLIDEARQRDIASGRLKLKFYLPASVRLPSNEEFGTFGWSYISQEAAEHKFQQLITTKGD